MSGVPGNEIPNTLTALDWNEITCQFGAGCTNRATHTVHLHVVDACNNPGLDPFGNSVGILCVACLRSIEARVMRQLKRLMRYGVVMHCLTCGAPVCGLTDIFRDVAAL
ncbi:hypothetical protein [Mycobacterium riyadhense]|uniref:Uncharacterized protein n=1 Tax=Mycobacterium riyadhense TaxID=486698 RepID=A0A1X2B077_9MYCO|nr:hypothetical protein [Mycobacterium riyadhense]MCV7147913.1 hypothetical protein [Mycobacterium riyadhense]ORW56981.1 hypothetical protein AWC22_00760 [Mycobacterium riyadhense]VTP03459.1 hypothetical protein BIN_B_05050 [Mycobacterium riyadhense]